MNIQVQKKDGEIWNDRKRKVNNEIDNKIKDFKLQLKDIKDEQKCGAALKVYKAERDNRIRKKKRKLLQSLRDIGKTILVPENLHLS